MIKEQKIKNSDVVRQTLFSLVCVASPKTSDDYAWAIVKRLVGELNSSYDFLKYVKITDLENIQNTINDINISSDINSVDPSEVGMAIQEMVDFFKMRMGAKAGYTFIKEFKDSLGDEYHTKIKKMGVDLRLIDLQNELSGIDSSSYKIRDHNSSNIAFIEKK